MEHAFDIFEHGKIVVQPLKEGNGRLILMAVLRSDGFATQSALAGIWGADPPFILDRRSWTQSSNTLVPMRTPMQYLA